MRAILLVVLLVGISACASTSDFDTLRSEMNDLKRDSFEHKKELASLREKTTGTVKEDSFTAVRENQADMNSRISEVASNLQDLRGRFEENKYSLEKTLKDSTSERDLLRAQIAGIENQLRALREKTGGVDTQSRPQDQQPSAAAANTDTAQEAKQRVPEQVVKESRNDKAKTYEAAYQSFKDRKYKEARERFEVFIKENPKHELADNAQFWIGETLYMEKDYEGAILAYESLLKKYPNSPKTSSALLKQGNSFIEIGDKKTGKIILQRLVDRFPDSREADVAKKKLAELDPKKPGKKK